MFSIFSSRNVNNRTPSSDHGGILKCFGQSSTIHNQLYDTRVVYVLLKCELNAIYSKRAQR